MRVKTETGSIYQIDHKGKRLRRESGNKAIHNHISLDGKWRPYIDISDIIVGQSIIAHWDVANFPVQEETPEGAIPVIITSPVIEILNELN